QSKIDAAHRIFIDRLRIDASDSTCNFGAALTTLLLSFEDTSNRFDACDHPELSHSLAPVLYELGGPLGLSLADRVFGPNGMLKQLNDARQLNQIGGLAKKTLLTVTRHYMNGQTPATENLPFSADYMVTTRDGFAIFDKTTRSVLRVTCPDGADQVKLGANMIADRGDVQNHNVAAPCFAEFRNKPGLFQSDEEQAQTSFMSRSDEIKTNLLSWTSYSVVNNAPAVGSIALTLYRRVFQGDWDTSEYIVIAGSLNDRTSDLNAILTSGIGELAGFISGEPPLIGRSPAFTFQFVADKLKAFVDGNLTAIINFLAAAGNDPQFSATIEPSMFFLPNDVDLRFDRADALLLLGALRGVRSLATYLYGFRWDFTFESDLDVRGLLCEKAITVLNPVFLKSKLDSPGLLTLLGGFRTGMLEAVQALRMAFETGKSLTTDAGPTHWQAINPDPASALDSLIGLTKALETELTSLAGTVLPMADDGNGNPISATFKSFFESPFVSTGTPPPFYCVTEQDKQETSTTMTDTFESAWLGSLFSPDVLTTQDLGLKLKYTASGESDPRDVDPFAVFQHFLETLEPLFSVLADGN
ncbi:MAG: hypothetical protein KC609_19375, partial [Myxococcales bacterium]|nr:hypothetical protein [Myxococcales bacterium]